MIQTSAYQIAQRFVGLKEVQGKVSNPQILAMLQLDQDWPKDDEVPWCSAFMNYVCWLLRLPRSKSLSARSWLSVGVPIDLDNAVADSDIVVLSRGNDPTSGHVGLFAGHTANFNEIMLLGGNQGDQVCVAPFDRMRVIGVRRLMP